MAPALLLFAMKSFTKLSLLFALIIIGRYMQPAATASLAIRPASVVSAQALPLVLARYTAPPQFSTIQPQKNTQALQAYYL
jgi:hypothetical protein